MKINNKNIAVESYLKIVKKQELEIEDLLLSDRFSYGYFLAWF
jgi:hypothetical protein